MDYRCMYLSKDTIYSKSTMITSVKMSNKFLTVFLIFILSVPMIFSLPKTAEAVEPFSSGHQYCRTLIAEAGGGTGGVATTIGSGGFALVYSATTSSMAATSSGGYIYELDANGEPVDFTVMEGDSCQDQAGATAIDFYFEKYDSTTGQMVLWVEPSAISSTTDTTLLMYYGFPDASATSLQDEAGVWGAKGETGVWNMNNDPTGTVLDSTANNLDGSSVGSMTSDDVVAGMVGNALDFDGNDGISIPDDAVLDISYITAGGWVRKTVANLSTYTGIIGRQTGTGSADNWVLFYWNNANDDMRAAADASASGSMTSYSTAGEQNVWVHYMFTYDGSNIYVYRNGALIITQAHAGGTMSADTNGLCLASNANSAAHTCSSEFFTGILDDFRMYNQALTAGEIQTIYNNTVDSSVFWTLGSEESNSSGVQRVVRLLGSVRLRGVRLY